MEGMRILSFDPASDKYKQSTTGVVLVDDLTLLDYAAVKGGAKGVLEWIDKIDKTEIDAVIYEDFDDYSTVADSSVKITIGAIRAVFPDAKAQRAAGYKQIATDEMLKGLGWYKTGGHHKDIVSAARHALYYIIKQAKITGDYTLIQQIGQKVLGEKTDVLI
jgi:hypothetical protein